METDFSAEIVSFWLVGGMHPPLNPPLAAGSIPVGRQFFRIASARRSGGSSLGFRAGMVAFMPEARKTIKHYNSGQQTSKTSKLTYY